MGLGIVGEGGGVGEGVMSRQVTSLDYHMYQGLINSLHILLALTSYRNDSLLYRRIC